MLKKFFSSIFVIHFLSFLPLTAVPIPYSVQEDPTLAITFFDKSLLSSSFIRAKGHTIISDPFFHFSDRPHGCKHTWNKLIRDAKRSQTPLSFALCMDRHNRFVLYRTSQDFKFMDTQLNLAHTPIGYYCMLPCLPDPSAPLAFRIMKRQSHDALAQLTIENSERDFKMELLSDPKQKERENYYKNLNHNFEQLKAVPIQPATSPFLPLPCFFVEHPSQNQLGGISFLDANVSEHFLGSNEKLGTPTLMLTEHPVGCKVSWRTLIDQRCPLTFLLCYAQENKTDRQKEFFFYQTTPDHCLLYPLQDDHQPLGYYYIPPATLPADADADYASAFPFIHKDNFQLFPPITPFSLCNQSLPPSSPLSCAPLQTKKPWEEDPLDPHLLKLWKESQIPPKVIQLPQDFLPISPTLSQSSENLDPSTSTSASTTPAPLTTKQKQKALAKQKAEQDALAKFLHDKEEADRQALLEQERKEAQRRAQKERDEALQKEKERLAKEEAAKKLKETEKAERRALQLAQGKRAAELKAAQIAEDLNKTREPFEKALAQVRTLADAKEWENCLQILDNPLLAQTTFFETEKAKDAFTLLRAMILIGYFKQYEPCPLSTKLYNQLRDPLFALAKRDSKRASYPEEVSCIQTAALYLIRLFKNDGPEKLLTYCNAGIQANVVECKIMSWYVQLLENQQSCSGKCYHKTLLTRLNNIESDEHALNFPEYWLCRIIVATSPCSTGSSAEKRKRGYEFLLEAQKRFGDSEQFKQIEKIILKNCAEVPSSILLLPTHDNLSLPPSAAKAVDTELSPAQPSKSAVPVLPAACANPQPTSKSLDLLLGKYTSHTLHEDHLAQRLPSATEINAHWDRLIQAYLSYFMTIPLRDAFKITSLYIDHAGGFCVFNAFAARLILEKEDRNRQFSLFALNSLKNTALETARAFYDEVERDISPEFADNLLTRQLVVLEAISFKEVDPVAPPSLSFTEHLQTCTRDNFASYFKIFARQCNPVPYELYIDFLKRGFEIGFSKREMIAHVETILQQDRPNLLCALISTNRPFFTETFGEKAVKSFSSALLPPIEELERATEKFCQAGKKQKLTLTFVPLIELIGNHLRESAGVTFLSTRKRLYPLIEKLFNKESTEEALYKVLYTLTIPAIDRYKALSCAIKQLRRIKDKDSYCKGLIHFYLSVEDRLLEERFVQDNNRFLREWPACYNDIESTVTTFLKTQGKQSITQRLSELPPLSTPEESAQALTTFRGEMQTILNSSAPIAITTIFEFLKQQTYKRTLPSDLIRQEIETLKRSHPHFMLELIHEEPTFFHILLSPSIKSSEYQEFFDAQVRELCPPYNVLEKLKQAYLSNPQTDTFIRLVGFIANHLRSAQDNPNYLPLQRLLHIDLLEIYNVASQEDILYATAQIHFPPLEQLYLLHLAFLQLHRLNTSYQEQLVTLYKTSIQPHLLTHEFLELHARSLQNLPILDVAGRAINTFLPQVGLPTLSPENVPHKAQAAAMDLSQSEKDALFDQRFATYLDPNRPLCINEFVHFLEESIAKNDARLECICSHIHSLESSHPHVLFLALQSNPRFFFEILTRAAATCEQEALALLAKPAALTRFTQIYLKNLAPDLGSVIVACLVQHSKPDGINASLPILMEQIANLLNMIDAGIEKDSSDNAREIRKNLYAQLICFFMKCSPESIFYALNRLNLPPIDHFMIFNLAVLQEDRLSSPDNAYVQKIVALYKQRLAHLFITPNFCAIFEKARNESHLMQKAEENIQRFLQKWDI